MQPQRGDIRAVDLWTVALVVGVVHRWTLARLDTSSSRNSVHSQLRKSPQCNTAARQPWKNPVSSFCFTFCTAEQILQVLSFVQVCRGYGDLDGDPMGMGIEIPSPRQPCISSIVAPCGLWCCTNRPSLFPGQRSYYFPSAAVGVDSSHMTASSSASWSSFSPPSNFVNGHMSTVWFMVCRWPQSQGDWVRPHLCKLARHGPWPFRKRFIRDCVYQRPCLTRKMESWRSYETIIPGFSCFWCSFSV